MMLSMAASTALLPGGGMLYMVRLLLAVRFSVPLHTWKLSECWNMLSMAASTAPLPCGGMLLMVRLMLAVRCSVTFTYVKVV